MLRRLIRSDGGFRPIVGRCCLLLTLFWIMAANPAIAKDNSESFSALSRFSGPQNAIVVADPCGNFRYADNPDQLLIPASSLKVFTALLALSHLGPDFRFTTEFYLDAKNNLKIKGYGDPLLISEAVDRICARLAESTHHVRHLIIDNSYFDGPVKVPGSRNGSLQPYDAPSGALCVNFNTIYFSSDHGRVVSAEPQTPLLPLAIRRIGKTGAPSGRILLTDDDGDAVVYAGELFSWFLRKHQVAVTGEIRCGTVDTRNDRLIYRHESEYPLTEVVKRLLKYSNNFIANQLFLATGAHLSGPPANLEKSVHAADLFAQTLGIKGMVIAEGSGISRRNRVSARMFMDILAAFAPYHDLMSKEGRIYFKTGTLKGISTRVGYVGTESGELLPFAVMINKPGQNAAEAMRRLSQIRFTSAPCPSPDPQPQ